MKTNQPVKAGRKPGPPWRAVTIRMGVDVHAALEKFCRKTYRTQRSVIESAIRKEIGGAA